MADMGVDYASQEKKFSGRWDRPGQQSGRGKQVGCDDEADVDDNLDMSARVDNLVCEYRHNQGVDDKGVDQKLTEGKWSVSRTFWLKWWFENLLLSSEMTINWLFLKKFLWNMLCLLCKTTQAADKNIVLSEENKSLFWQFFNNSQLPICHFTNITSR